MTKEEQHPRGETSWPLLPPYPIWRLQEEGSIRLTETETKACSSYWLTAHCLLKTQQGVAHHSFLSCLLLYIMFRPYLWLATKCYRCSNDTHNIINYSYFVMRAFINKEFTCSRQKHKHLVWVGMCSLFYSWEHESHLHLCELLLSRQGDAHRGIPVCIIVIPKPRNKSTLALL